MKNGTKDDYQLLEKLESQYERKTADRILNYLASQTTTLEGYQITRLEHSLQAATRAYKNGENEETLCFGKNLLDYFTSRSISNLLFCRTFRWRQKCKRKI